MCACVCVSFVFELKEPNVCLLLLSDREKSTVVSTLCRAAHLQLVVGWSDLGDGK